MTFYYTFKPFPTTAAIVLAAALSAAPSTSASTKRIDCKRMATLITQQDSKIRYQEAFLVSTPDIRARNQRSLEGLLSVYAANCSKAVRTQIQRDAQGEALMQSFLGMAIGLGSSVYSGAGGAGYGHGPRVHRGGRDPWR